MSESAQTSCPAEVLALIAWYPDDLSPEEREAVEVHAAECEDCRREVEAMAGDSAIEADAPDPERVFARVLSANELAEAERLSARRAAPRRERALGWLRERELRVPGFATGISFSRGVPVLASLCAIVVLAASLYDEAPSWFSSGRTTMPAEAGVAGASVLDVVFQEEATLADVASALRDVEGQIVSGPSPFGRYRVRLAPEADGAAAAKLLLGSGVVVYAEPAR